MIKPGRQNPRITTWVRIMYIMLKTIIQGLMQKQVMPPGICRYPSLSPLAPPMILPSVRQAY